MGILAERRGGMGRKPSTVESQKEGFLLPSHRGEVRTTDDNRAGLTILGTKLVGNRVTALIIGVIIVVAAALCVGTLGPWKSAQGPGDAKWNGYAVKDLVGESFESLFHRISARNERESDMFEQKIQPRVDLATTLAGHDNPVLARASFRERAKAYHQAWRLPNRPTQHPYTQGGFYRVYPRLWESTAWAASEAAVVTHIDLANDRAFDSLRGILGVWDGGISVAVRLTVPQWAEGFSIASSLDRQRLHQRVGEYLGRVERFDPGNIGSDEQQGTAAEGDIVYGGLPDFDVGAGDSDGEVGDFGDAETAPLRGLREGGLPRIRNDELRGRLGLVRELVRSWLIWSDLHHDDMDRLDVHAVEYDGFYNANIGRTVAMDHAPSDFLLLLLDPRQIPAPSSFEHLLRFKPSLCGSPVAVVLPAFGPPASKRADSTGADSTTGTRAGDSMWKREERGGKKKEGGDERGGTQGGRGEVRAANSEAEEAFPAVSVACYDTWHLAEEVEAGRMELLSDLRDTSRVPELADTSQGTLGGRETGTALSLSGPDGVRRDAAAVAAWLRQEIPLTRDVSGDALWGLAGGVALHRSVLTPRLDPLFGEGDLALGSFLAELQAFGFQPMLLAGFYVCEEAGREVAMGAVADREAEEVLFTKWVREKMSRARASSVARAVAYTSRPIAQLCALFE